MEYIDIFDANLKYLGKEERVKAHLDGQWHKTFHCWIVSEKNGGQILFQSRSPQMANYPNCLDVSAAGHIMAGETIEDGVREVREELGINFSLDNMYCLGYRVEVADQANGQKNREYQSVHILKHDVLLSEYSPQLEEVNGLFWLKLNDGISLFNCDKESSVINGIVYDNNSKRWITTERKVKYQDFLPRIPNYYLTVCIMGQRILNKQFPVSIS